MTAVSGPLQALTIVTALGCGLNAGVFFAFSSFVMQALARLEPPQAVAAMQSINARAVTPVFMLALFGTGLLCVVLAGWALTDLSAASAPYLLAGCALYVLGGLLMTMGFHVPRNTALDRVEPAGPGAERAWNDFFASWLPGNHVARDHRVRGGRGADRRARRLKHRAAQAGTARHSRPIWRSIGG